MKQQALCLSIPQPCTEDWSQMTPAGQGRFCASCSKCVVDFTSWTDEALYRYFSAERGPVCGRFLDTQLRRSIALPNQPHSRLYRLALALGLSLVLLQPGETSARPLPPLTEQSSFFEEDATPDSSGNGRTISGTVVDERGEPLVNAIITLLKNGFTLGWTATDFDGKFSIEIADSCSGCELVVKYIGHLTSQTTVTGKKKKIKIRMKANRSFIVGALVNYNPPLIDKKDPGSTTTISKEQIRRMR